MWRTCYRAYSIYFCPPHSLHCPDCLVSVFWMVVLHLLGGACRTDALYWHVSCSHSVPHAGTQRSAERCRCYSSSRWRVLHHQLRQTSSWARSDMIYWNPAVQIRDCDHQLELERDRTCIQQTSSIISHGSFRSSSGDTVSTEHFGENVVEPIPTVFYHNMWSSP